MANAIYINENSHEQTINVVVRDSERGPQGDQGVPGIAATITAGEAYTVPYGSQPAVMNTGNEQHAVFDFYIPSGATGPRGPKGEDGKDGKNGANGTNGTNGRDGYMQYQAGEGILINGNTISAINGGGIAPSNYTTSEVDTGATWIDGSHIYKKTFNLGPITKNSSASAALPEDFNLIISFEGFGIIKPHEFHWDWIILPLGRATGSSGFQAQSTHQQITVFWTTDGNDNISESYITLYYTKFE